MTSRNYVWTLNNYTEEELATLSSEEFKSKTLYCVYGKEKGEEKATPHLQGYCIFRTPLRLAAVKKLISGRIYAAHRKGTHAQASDYCKKQDPEFIEWGEEKSTEKRVNPHALALEADNYESACEILRTQAPRDWLINGERMMGMLKRKFVPDFPEYVPIHSIREFRVFPQLNQWLGLWDVSRTPCLLLHGETKLGKTAWARSLVQPHIYWKGYTNLDDWNPNAKLLICDDIDWKYMPAPKNYLTQSGHCTVTDKYRRKININVNMPAIFICNNPPDCSPEQDYWNKNFHKVEIQDVMYK